MQVRGNGSNEVSVSLYHNYGRRWSLLVVGVLHCELNRLKLEHTHGFSYSAIVFQFKDTEGSPILVDTDIIG